MQRLKSSSVTGTRTVSNSGASQSLSPESAKFSLSVSDGNSSSDVLFEILLLETPSSSRALVKICRLFSHFLLSHRLIFFHISELFIGKSSVLKFPLLINYFTTSTASSTDTLASLGISGHP